MTDQKQKAKQAIFPFIKGRQFAKPQSIPDFQNLKVSKNQAQRANESETQQCSSADYNTYLDSIDMSDLEDDDKRKGERHKLIDPKSSFLNLNLNM